MGRSVAIIIIIIHILPFLSSSKYKLNITKTYPKLRFRTFYIKYIQSGKDGGFGGDLRRADMPSLA